MNRSSERDFRWLAAARFPLRILHTCPPAQFASHTRSFSLGNLDRKSRLVRPGSPAAFQKGGACASEALCFSRGFFGLNAFAAGGRSRPGKPGPVQTGSSMPEPLYKGWIAVYHKETPSTELRYMPLGSGESARNVLAGSGDFGAAMPPFRSPAPRGREIYSRVARGFDWHRPHL